MFKNHPKGLLAAALSNMGERFGYYIMNAVLLLFLVSKFGLSDTKAGLIYSILAVIFIFLGSILSNDLVWELTDMFNNIMVIPNVIALVALGGMVVSCTKFKKDKKLKVVE